MTVDPNRKPGFFWVRFEGSVQVMEWRAGSWLACGSPEGFTNGEVCELLSGRLWEPVPATDSAFGDCADRLLEALQEGLGYTTPRGRPTMRQTLINALAFNMRPLVGEPRISELQTQIEVLKAAERGE